MDKENDKEIDFEKTQSVIIDYLDTRNEAKWVVSAAIGSGIFLLFLTYSLLGLIEKIEFRNDIDATYFFLVLATLLAIGIWLPITCGGLLLKFVYKRNVKDLLSVHNSLIRRSYLINFEIVSAKGQTQLEKLVNHLSLVFPEIKIKQKKLEKKGINLEKFKKRQNFFKKINFLKNYDLVLGTKTGLFIIKIFDNPVTFDDIEKNIKALNIHQIGFKFFGPKHIERVIFLSKSYDKFFDTSELVDKMKNLKRMYRLDLILEEDEYGYATVWVD